MRVTFSGSSTQQAYTVTGKCRIRLKDATTQEEATSIWTNIEAQQLTSCTAGTTICSGNSILKCSNPVVGFDKTPIKTCQSPYICSQATPTTASCTLSGGSGSGSGGNGLLDKLFGGFGGLFEGTFGYILMFLIGLVIFAVVALLFLLLILRLTK